MQRIFQRDVNIFKKLKERLPKEIVLLICEFMNPFFVHGLADVTNSVTRNVGMFNPQDIRLRLTGEYSIGIIDWILFKNYNIIELEICDSIVGDRVKTLKEICELPNLETLIIRSLPVETIEKFPPKLKKLELKSMYSLRHIPEFPPNIEKIYLENMWEPLLNIPKLPDSVRLYSAVDAPMPREYSKHLIKPYAYTLEKIFDRNWK